MTPESIIFAALLSIAPPLPLFWLLPCLHFVLFLAASLSFFSLRGTQISAPLSTFPSGLWLLRADWVGGYQTQGSVSRASPGNLHFRQNEPTFTSVLLNVNVPEVQHAYRKMRISCTFSLMDFQRVNTWSDQHPDHETEHDLKAPSAPLQ